MKPKTSNWSKDDYLAFLLLYMAEVDLETHRKELLYIANEIGVARLHEIEPQVEKCNDYQCIEIITELRDRYYPGEKGKDELLEEVRQLCNADGQYTEMEQAASMYLKKLL